MKMDNKDIARFYEAGYVTPDENGIFTMEQLKKCKNIYENEKLKEEAITFIDKVENPQKIGLDMDFGKRKLELSCKDNQNNSYIYESQHVDENCKTSFISETKENKDAVERNNRINTLLDERKYTQNKIAKITGTSQSTVSKVKNNKI